MSSKSKYLIIVCAGEASLHHPWLSLDDQCDLLVIDYSKNQVHRNRGARFYYEAIGPKWMIVNRALIAFESNIRQYKYIWIPDDDIFINRNNIIEIFKIAEKYNLSIAQPALSKDSYYSYKFTLKVPLVEVRLTNFVEIMAPLFKTEILYDLNHSFDITKSGWGIDFIFQKLAYEKGLNLGIIDKYEITHTRPLNIVLSNGNESKKSGFYQEFEVSPLEDRELLLNQFDIKPQAPRNLRVYFNKYMRLPKIWSKWYHKKILL